MAWPLLGALFFARATLAATPPPGDNAAYPGIDILEVDAKGDTRPLPWPTKVLPVWTGDVPVLRLWAEIPPEFVDFRVQKSPASSGKSGYLIVEKPTGSPFPAGSKVLALDLSSGSNLSPISIRLLGKGAKTVELSLVISPDLDHPSLLLQDSCEKLGVKVSVLKPGAHILFAAASCAAGASGRVMVRFFHSREGAWGLLPRTGGARQKDGSYLLGLEKPAPKTAPLAAKTPAWVSVSVKDAAGGVSEYQFERSPEAAPVKVKRVGLLVGLGASELSYLEPGLGVHLVETGLTGKVTGYYLLRPGLFDLGVNAFMTLLPVLHSPDSIVSARFYGANARAGWQLPFSPGGLAFTLSAGWYFWGMLVPGSAFGVSFLSGPQLFLLARGNLKDGRVYSIYLKFAPISAGFTPSFSNRELAAGGAYPLSKAGAAHPLSLTLDFADAAFTSADGLNSLRLTSASLGVQMGF